MRNARELDQELMDCAWICAKCHDDDYAQNLYASMCNMQWQPSEMMPILKDEVWSVSWRGAGHIVADIRNKLNSQADGHSVTEDYLSWYCSGMSHNSNEWGEEDQTKYVPEGTVTEEIRNDLAKLGWHPIPYSDGDLD